MNQNQAAITQISGKPLPLVGNDIDTDRIIPARFLRAITFEDLGEEVFRDERFASDGSEQDHPFNDTRYKGASILIVNRNFGCGSSREHAPQAIMRFGIKAIIGQSFAEIFAGNCTSLGIPTFTGTASVIEMLQQQAQQAPATEIHLDIESKTAKSNGNLIQLDMVESARTALLSGTWDTLAILLKNEESIDSVYKKLPYVSGFFSSHED